MEMVEAGRDHDHYQTPLQGPNRGRGVAAGFWFNGAGPSSATASVLPDGSVSLVEGSPDIGGTRVAVAMQLAEVLGITAEDVKPMVGDTDSVGWTSVTGGSGGCLQDRLGGLRSGTGRQEPDDRPRRPYLGNLSG